MAYRTERTALGLVLGLLAAPGSAPAQSAPELGVWINHTGKGAVETYLCGSNLCGKIVWLKEPNNDSGKPKRDANNPDPNKRNRPVCGVHTLANLKRTSGGWSDGQAYNPEEGKTYDVSIRLADSDTLKVTGSVLFFSKTVVWKRAKGQIQRCDKPAAPPPAPAPTAAAPPPPAAAPVAKPAATTPAAAAAAAASAAPPAPVAPPPPTKPAAVTAVATPIEPAVAAPATPPVTAVAPAAAPAAPVAPNPATVKAAPPPATPSAQPVLPAPKVAAPAPAATPAAKPAPVTGTAKPAPQAKATAPANKPVAAKTPVVPGQPAPAAIKPTGSGIPTATGYAGSSDTSAYKPRPKPRPQAVDAGSSFDPTPQASR